MFKKSIRVGGLAALLWLLVAISAAGYTADNAVVTGDGVRVRTQPSAAEEVVEVLAKGTRVEAVSKTNFTETIDGHTAPWYEVRHGDLRGFVFGRFVALDAGVSVPADESGAGYSDPIYRFTIRGVSLFGRTESEVIKNLGRPISRTQTAGLYPGDVDHTLTYDGIVILIYQYAAGGRVVYQVSYTTDSHTFEGLRVGSSFSDVERLLGTKHAVEGDTLTYGDNTGYLSTSFKVKDGKVVEIIFFSDYYD